MIVENPEIKTTFACDFCKKIIKGGKAEFREWKGMQFHQNCYTNVINFYELFLFVGEVIAPSLGPVQIEGYKNE